MLTITKQKREFQIMTARNENTMKSNKRIKLESQNQELYDSARTQWGRLISCLPQLDSVDLVHMCLKLGRSEECDIVIHKSKFLPEQLFYISKQHFIIERDLVDHCIAYIWDMSKNGTFVNDELIGNRKRFILQNNDSISIGDKLKVYIFKSMNYSVDENYLPRELKKRYEPSRLLGTGACGEVRLAYEKHTCKKYAIKKIIKGRNTASQMNMINHPSRIRTEISILQTLSHPLVVNMKEIVETDDEVFLVLEYVSGGELSTRLSQEPKLSESGTKFLFYQMVLAVQYLHSKGVTHRDLKPCNVLLSSTSKQAMIKVTDFGLSNVSEGYDMMKTVCGTWYYIAPEVLNHKVSEYDNQVDVWSLGVILFYMLSKRLPFQSKDKSTLGRLIVNGSYSMDDQAWYEVSAAAKDLVKHMLIVDPQRRITTDQILNHPWIKGDHLLHYQVEKLVASEKLLLSETDYAFCAPPLNIPRRN